MNLSFPTVTSEFYLAALPVLILCTGAIINMLQTVIPSIGSAKAVYGVLMVSLLGSIASAVTFIPGIETAYLNGAYLAGDLARFGQVLVLVIAVLVSMFFYATHLKERFCRGEIASLYLMIITGMLVMVSSEDLITLFVGLELSSIGLYSVVGYMNPGRRSQEGAIKYFVLGSFASAILLFGMGLLYASTGSMRLSEIVETVPKLFDHNWVKLGTVFLSAGLGFKLALVPFHLWAPDAYEAAPTGITALMATSVKVMILIVAMRLFAGTLNTMFEVWLPGLTFLAGLSMIAGNIMALVQSSLKRMLAYSSIAHSGYLAVAICAISGGSPEFPAAAVLYYLVGYAIISVGAFGIIMWLESPGNDNLQLDDLAGLAKTFPKAAFALTVFMFAFAGMPPTVGFISKFFVFNAALNSQLYGLVAIGVIGSTISLFYYLRVIVKMYMTEPVQVTIPLAPVRSRIAICLVGLAVVLTILLGTVLPGPAMRLMSKASQEVASY